MGLVRTSKLSPDGHVAVRNMRLSTNPVMGAQVVNRSSARRFGWLLVSRVAIFVVALSAPLLFNPGSSYPNVWRAWSQWDVRHFQAIAEFGYDHGEPSGAPLAAFFPGLPSLMRVGSWFGLGTVGSGVLVSLIASGVAGIYLARLARHEFPTVGVQKPGGFGPKAALLWYAAPVGVFLAAPYTEALFCALAFPASARP